jgi:hypothetical protein
MESEDDDMSVDDPEESDPATPQFGPTKFEEKAKAIKNLKKVMTFGGSSFGSSTPSLTAGTNFKYTGNSPLGGKAFAKGVKKDGRKQVVCFDSAEKNRKRLNAMKASNDSGKGKGVGVKRKN